MVLFSNMARILWVVLFLSPFTLQAKYLEGRLGTGVSYQAFTSAGAVSFKYFHNNYLASNFLVGFNTETGNYLIGARSLRNVVLEENMNIHLGLGASLLTSQNGAGGNDSGIEIDALFGGEFFMAGLPNLGFSFDIGVGLRSHRTTSFRTVGGGFASGGIHYYF